MREFSKVSPLMWRDKTFRSLSSSDAKLFYLYICTSEHQTSAGCYRIPDGYAAADLGWEQPQLIRARQEVIEAGLVAYDADTCEIFVARWFETNPITNVKHYQGTLKHVLNVESDAIREAVEEALETSEAERQEKEQIKAAHQDRAITPFRNHAR